MRVLNRRVAVAKDASPWQKQALNKLDASSSSMEEKLYGEGFGIKVQYIEMRQMSLTVNATYIQCLVIPFLVELP